MIRTILTEFGLFIAPFALYALFLWATKAGVFVPESWPVRRIVWLAIVSLLLMIGSFVYFAHFSGEKPGSTYIPAHIEDGKFVPGQLR